MAWWECDIERGITEGVLPIRSPQHEMSASNQAQVQESLYPVELLETYLHLWFHTVKTEKLKVPEELL